MRLNDNRRKRQSSRKLPFVLPFSTSTGTSGVAIRKEHDLPCHVSLVSSRPDLRVRPIGCIWTRDVYHAFSRSQGSSAHHESRVAYNFLVGSMNPIDVHFWDAMWLPMFSHPQCSSLPAGYTVLPVNPLMVPAFRNPRSWALQTLSCGCSPLGRLLLNSTNSRGKAEESSSSLTEGKIGSPPLGKVLTEQGQIPSYSKICCGTCAESIGLSNTS